MKHALTILIRQAALGVALAELNGQVLFEDQASGQVTEIVTTAVFTPPNQIVQSFTPVLSGIGFIQLQTYVSPQVSGGGVTVVIELREGGSLGPVIATTTPLFMQNVRTEFTTFLFSNNVAIAPNQTYYFQPTVLSGGVLDVAFKSPSPYARGGLFSNGRPADPLADLWFREGIVVPEPAVAWLGLPGFGALLVHRRRVRKS